MENELRYIIIIIIVVVVVVVVVIFEVAHAIQRVTYLLYNHCIYSPVFLT